MKRVLIIGATGSLASYVIEAFSKLDKVELTLFARNISRLPGYLTQSNKTIQGNAMNYDDIKTAIAGQDIVYVNLAGNLDSMTKNIVNAMKEEHVERIIAVSSIGIYQEPVKTVLIPYRKLADIIEASGLDYTILRPDWFTNADEIDYAITYKGEPEKGSAVSRKSIASFIAGIVSNPDTYSRQNVGISRV